MTDLTYRSPKTEVKPSRIHGKGLFAKAAIPRGEIVAVKGGHILNQQEWTELEKELGSAEIQNVLETQQGTGTFIGSISVQISAEERQSKLASICAEFLSIAASYGFSIEEMTSELKQRQGGEI